jgi:hypothetical protein
MLDEILELKMPNPIYRAYIGLHRPIFGTHCFLKSLLKHMGSILLRFVTIF